MPIKNRFAELHNEIRSWRHTLHETPELLYETFETSAFVEKKLKSFGCDEVIVGIGKTGVVGIIKGKTNTSKKIIGLRADMDALPIHENTDLKFSSMKPGVMHACGHDGHTAMLLGASKYLSETRNFDGTTVVIFQPAEEGGGGAKAMIEDGLIEKFDIQEVYGMHNMPGLPVGQFSIREGDFFAAADTFSIEIKGKGGHAAKPHETIDPLIAASNLVLALQTIASRKIDPVRNIVVSVCTFKTDTDSFNVIPQAVALKGTVRSFDSNTQQIAHDQVTKIANSIAETYGASATVDYKMGYPVMTNSLTETELVKTVAERVSGRPAVAADKVMGAEDFSFMLNATKGAYILIGNGNSSQVHSPTYTFADDAIPLGSSFWAELVETRMQIK